MMSTATILGAMSLGTLAAVQVAGEPIPVAIVPVINLTAIIGGGIALGMLVNRVKQLERRMEKVQDYVFHESAPWAGSERRHRHHEGDQ